MAEAHNNLFVADLHCLEVDFSVADGPDALNGRNAVEPPSL